MTLVSAIAAASFRNPVPACHVRANRNNNTQPTLRVGD